MYKDILGTCIKYIFVKYLVILDFDVVAILDFRVTGVSHHKNNVRNRFLTKKNIGKEVSLDRMCFFYKT